MSTADLDNFAVMLMNRFTIRSCEETRDLDDFICDDCHPAVQQMLRGEHDDPRPAVGAKRSTSSASMPRKRARLWPEKHAAQYDSQGRDWWESGHPTAAEYEAYPGLKKLTPREVDVLGLCGAKYPDLRKGTVDVYNSGHRSSKRINCSRIITPGARLHLLHRCRLLTAYETMLLQGIHFGDKMHQLVKLPPHRVQDLSGNAFQGWCCAASLLVLFSMRAKAWQNARAYVSRPMAALASMPVDDVDAASDLDSCGSLGDLSVDPLDVLLLS